MHSASVVEKADHAELDLGSDPWTLCRSRIGTFIVRSGWTWSTFRK